METIEEMLKQLNTLYEEQVTLEKEYYDRIMELIGSGLVEKINEIKDETNSILYLVRKKIRDLEKAIRSKVLDQEQSYDSSDLYVEYTPWTKITTTFPGTESDPIIQSQQPRVKITRKNNKQKRYREAALMMRLF